MPKNNNSRKPPRTRHRTSAAAARARQQARRRSIATAVVALIIVALLGSLFVGLFGGGSKSTTTTSSSSTSSSTPLKSAAGKPCVKVSSPLPSGAPAVPVQTGPPPTKLVIKDLKAGTGAVVKAGATLTVDYIGVACSTGKIFDSSYARKQPATFPLGQVIPGWQQGLPGMRIGGERLLGIPPAQGYGSTGQAPTIAPDETLWFVVHVISAK